MGLSKKSEISIKTCTVNVSLFIPRNNLESLVHIMFLAGWGQPENLEETHSITRKNMRHSTQTVMRVQHGTRNTGKAAVLPATPQCYF